jgi:hypothetical protein
MPKWSSTCLPRLRPTVQTPLLPKNERRKKESCLIGKNLFHRKTLDNYSKVTKDSEDK